MQLSIFGYKVELEVLILIVVLYLVIIVHTACSCTNMFGLIESFKSSSKSKKEGFAGANTNYGESSVYSLGNYDSVDTSKWGQPNLTYKKGGKQNQAVKDFFNRPDQPIPLPEGELDMFATTPFKPECCPNTFSTSTGCACMTMGQDNYLNSRGGNNVPYSEY